MFGTVYTWLIHFLISSFLTGRSLGFVLCNACWEYWSVICIIIHLVTIVPCRFSRKCSLISAEWIKILCWEHMQDNKRSGQVLLPSTTSKFKHCPWAFHPWVHVESLHVLLLYVAHVYKAWWSELLQCEIRLLFTSGRSYDQYKHLMEGA